MKMNEVRNVDIRRIFCNSQSDRQKLTTLSLTVAVAGKKQSKQCLWPVYTWMLKVVNQ